MIQIASVGLICAVLSLTVRSYRPEFSVYISIACGLLLFAMIAAELEDIISYLYRLIDGAGSARIYFPVLLKVLGIAYLTDFTAQICRDAKESGIASKVEMAGKILIFYAALPVFTSLIRMLEMLLNI